MTKGMYLVFIYFFAAGAVSSLLMLFMILLKVRRSGRIWAAAFAVCVLNNLLFYSMIPVQAWLQTKEKLQITLVLLWLATAAGGDCDGNYYGGQARGICPERI